MTNPMIRIHNTQTNELIDREMTDEEYQIYIDAQKEPILTEKELEVKQAKVEAEAKLVALGLTLDDLRALGLQHNL